MTGPLDGVRVIDLGTRIAAPFCAGLLGEQGAEVIKVEQPRGGDFMREIGPFVDSDDGPYSLFWAVEGRGRKSVTLDLRTPEGQDLYRRLAATADVVVENFRPGTLEQWNIGPTACDPHLVTVRISMFGQDGPNSAAARSRSGRDRLRRPAASHRLPGPAAGARRRHHLRLPHRHLRRARGHRRAVRARFTRWESQWERGGDRCRPLRRGAAHPGVDARRLRPARRRAQPRGQPPRQLRAARQLPDARRQVRLHRGRLRRELRRACARRWNNRN